MIYTNENWKPPVTYCEPNKVKEAPQAEPVCEHFYKGYCSRFEDGCFCQCRKGDIGDKRRSI